MSIRTRGPQISSPHSDLIISQLHNAGLKVPARKGSRVPVESQPSIEQYQKIAALLQKQLKDSEASNQTIRATQKQLLKRCRVQRKLITHLRQKVGEQSQQLSEFDYKYLLTDNKDARDNNGRVVSLNSALLRINGVEEPASQTLETQRRISREMEAFGHEEFQPIQRDEEPGRLADQLVQCVKQIRKSISWMITTLVNKSKGSG